MKALSSLPENYKEIYSIDLKKDKKMSLLVNGIALIIMVAFIIPMTFAVPIYETFNMYDGVANYWIKFVILMALLIVYMVLHELVHGIAMKICGTKKVKYGFTGIYAYAGSADYYSKRQHIFIGLAPIFVWGIVLGVINLFVSPEWFWVVYMLQAANLSGAAGDLFVAVKFSRMPKDILVQDYGVGMKVYSAS